MTAMFDATATDPGRAAGALRTLAKRLYHRAPPPPTLPGLA